MTRSWNSPAAPRSVSVWNGGANRGALLGLDALEHWARERPEVSLVPRYVDPVPGRALAVQREAERRGLIAHALEGRIEEVLPRSSQDDSPVILNLDQAGAVSQVLRATETHPRAVLTYLLIQPPRGGLWGMRSFLSPADAVARREATRLFDKMAELTARRSSRALVGDDAPPENLVVESAHRSWMATHTRENLGKMVAGLPAEANPLEVTLDGQTTLPLIVLENDEWAEPLALAERLGRNPPMPLLRGESFIVAELAILGMRLHRLHLRKTDGRVSWRGQTAFDFDALEQESRDAERRRLEREAEQALRRAQRESVTRTAPLLTTD